MEAQRPSMQSFIDFLSLLSTLIYSPTCRQPSDAGRSGSPASEAGYPSDDGKLAQKGKGKSKTKRAGMPRSA